LTKVNLVSIKKRLLGIYNRKRPPKEGEILPVVIKATDVLSEEDPNIRPHDSIGFPGGLIYLKKHIPTIIVPDLHARMDFFLNIVFHKDKDEITTIQKLSNDELQIVCVGDGFHAESRAATRWLKAYQEYTEEYKNHSYMDDEMRESLGLMEMVMEMKINFPSNFHFLKGNHENIANERGEGNYPFRKFAMEGEMVTAYIRNFYSEDFMLQYYIFEKHLPLLAVGKNFLISHSEPQRLFTKEEIIHYRKNHEVIEGLTWTDNNQAEENSVTQMLEYYLGKEGIENYYYFGGHRPVVDLYNQRASGRYVQIHNPSKFIIAYIQPEKKIFLREDIVELENKTEEIVRNKHL